MTTRPIAATGCITAAILLAIAGLPAQAKSDNTSQKISPVQGSSATSWDSLAESFGGSKADTRPSRDTTMQFPSSTEIREVIAVGGQRVKKGDVLIRARDADILAAIAVQKDLAENDNEIQGAQKQAELAKFKLDRLQGAQTQFSPTEYEEARIGAEVSKVQFEQAKRNKQQNVLKLKQAEAQHERYYLEAPFDGIVEEVMVEVGEGVTEQTKVLRLVNIEKLWLDPYAATSDTIRQDLKQGSPAWVLVEMPDAPRLVQGKVLYVSPVADSVSQTRRVRVEIDNPQLWPAGTQARVRFTDPGSDWEKYKTTAPTTANTSPLWERALSASSGAFPPSAPEGPQSLAVGVNPRNTPAPTSEPRRGDTSAGKTTRANPASPNASDEVRQVVAEMLADAESRSSLLAGGDAHNSRFFVAGDPDHRDWGWYIVNADGSRTPFRGNICWRLPQNFGTETASVPLPPSRADEELRIGSLVWGPPGAPIGDSSK
jgi:RND family efflux transporter MFP subunit